MHIGRGHTESSVVTFPVLPLSALGTTYIVEQVNYNGSVLPTVFQQKEDQIQANPSHGRISNNVAVFSLMQMGLNT